MTASEIDPEKFVPVDVAVLCFVRDLRRGRLLLMHKKTGLGAGLVNAPGGRVEPGETPLEAAVRETKEEVFVVPADPRHAGDLYFRFTDGYSIRGYVFVAEDWEGEPGESAEADPFWCDESEIPYDGMWADDSWWLPHLLAGRRFSGRFVFDGETMQSMILDVDGGIEGIPPAHRLHKTKEL